MVKFPFHFVSNSISFSSQPFDLLLQREVLVVELEDDVEVGDGVPVQDVGGDGIPVVPDPLEVYRCLPLRRRGTTTRAAAAAASGIGFDYGGGGGGGGGGGEEAERVTAEEREI